MKIIAESGATKTAWRAIADEGGIHSVETEGLNPNTVDSEMIQSVIRKAVPALNPDGESVKAIYFYGAGISSKQAAAPIRYELELHCPFAEIHFYSDMLAAARALWGDGSGVVAIMGTGSNSCLYENGYIIRNIRPGGYVLGDEGSAMSVGKALISDYIKGLLPEHIEKELNDIYQLDYQTIVQKVYREQAPSAYLASFAPFVTERQEDPYMIVLLEDCLEAFIKRSISRYSGRNAGKVGVVGSFGLACENQLRKIGAAFGLEFVEFMKSPIDELVKYHSLP